jgi:hypothetical protein
MSDADFEGELPAGFRLALEVVKREVKEWFSEEFRAFKTEIRQEYAGKHVDHYSEINTLKTRTALVEDKVATVWRVIVWGGVVAGGTLLSMALVQIFGGK